MGISAAVFVVATVLAIDPWITMQAIESQDALGQTFVLEEYENAADDFQTFASIAVAGFGGLILFGFGSIGEILKDLGGS